MVTVSRASLVTSLAAAAAAAAAGVHAALVAR